MEQGYTREVFCTLSVRLLFAFEAKERRRRGEEEPKRRRKDGEAAGGISAGFSEAGFEGMLGWGLLKSYI